MPSPFRRWQRNTRTARSSWALVAASVLLPLLIFLLASWQNRREVIGEAEAQVRQTVTVLHEHALKVFETHRLVIGQINERLRTFDDASPADAESTYRLLNDLQEQLDQVATITVTDVSGHMRVSSRVYPVTPSVSFADRDWFQAVSSGQRDSVFISRSYKGRQSGQSIFNVVAPARTAPGAPFAGAIAVSVDRTYFEGFYRQVEAQSEHEVSLLRDDGAVLAHDPPTALTAAAADAPLFAAVRTAPLNTVYTVAGLDGVERFTASRKVGDYPVFVSFGIGKEAALTPWRQHLVGYGVTAALASGALLAASGLAIRRSQREETAREALARAQTELQLANTSLEAQVASRTQELQDSNEELQRYAYIVSHDLRAPLVNIMGFVGEIDASREDIGRALSGRPEATRLDGDLSEAIGFIQASVTKMESLIAAILKLAKEGRRVSVPEPLNMTPLVQDLADAIRHQTDAARAQIVVSPALPDLTSDRLAVQQVFGNLLDNAVKYLSADRAGHITVTGEVRGAQAFFRVADNGRGIADADQARVFDLFRRAGTQDRPGEGIGLAQVRATVRSLGGRISLVSRVGEGSTFIVALPIAPPENKTANA